MKEIIEVISNAFNRGYVLGKSTADGGIISKHDLQNALKEEIEFACKKIQPHNKADRPDANYRCDSCGKVMVYNFRVCDACATERRRSS